MRRRLFASTSAVSLLLLVLVGVLWVRSYFTNEYLIVRPGLSMGEWHVTAQSSQGECSLSAVQRVFTYASTMPPQRYGSQRPLDLLAAMPAAEDPGVRMAFCFAGCGLFWSDGMWDPLESTCRHASLSIL